MFFFACHSVFFCVGGMEHSDLESDFELQEVDLDGFSNDCFETTSEVLRSSRNATVGKRVTVMMWRVAMTLMVRTFMMLMTCNGRMMLVKLITKVPEKNENGEQKQILG